MSSTELFDAASISMTSIEVAARDGDARLAHAARRDGRALLAVQAGGEDLRHRRLARAARADEQVGVVDLVLLDRVAQRAHDVLLPDDLVEGPRAVAAVQRGGRGHPFESRAGGGTEPTRARARRGSRSAAACGPRRTGPTAWSPAGMPSTSPAGRDRGRREVRDRHEARPLQPVHVGHGRAVDERRPRVLRDVAGTVAGVVVRERDRRHDRAEDQVVALEEPPPRRLELQLLLLEGDELVVGQAHRLRDPRRVAGRVLPPRPRPP